MDELIDEFDVTTEIGELRRLYVFQDIIPAGSFGDPHATVRGLMRVEDEEGYAVNVTVAGEYEIVALGLKAFGRAIRTQPI